MRVNQNEEIPVPLFSESKQVAHIHDLILSFRPWAFHMTGVSVLLGSLIALIRQGNINILFTLLVLIGLVAVHAATNILNDYFDTRYGVDRPGSPTTLYRPHPVLDGIFTARDIIIISFILYTAGGLIGTYLFLLRGWPIAALMALGIFASIAYTAGPIKYKYRGMGEISVFLMWGPLMTFGSYYVQTGNWNGVGTVFAVSFPIGILVALVLLANNLKDMHYDAAIQIETLATKLGLEKALKLFVALVYVVYILNGIFIVCGLIPKWALLVFLSFPLATQLINTFRKERTIPIDADPRTGRLSLAYGGLLILSFTIEAINKILL